MKHRDRDMVPKVLVQAMFTLMIAAVLLVAYARLTDRPVIGVAPHSDIVALLARVENGDPRAVEGGGFGGGGQGGGFGGGLFSIPPKK